VVNQQLQAMSTEQQQLKMQSMQYKVAALREDASQHKYFQTLKRYLAWAAANGYEDSAATIDLWCTHLAAAGQCSGSTCDQYISHLNHFATMGVLAEGRVPAHKQLIRGIIHTHPEKCTVKYLPPSAVLRIAHMTDPSPVHIGMCFQSTSGLRGGQLVLLKPHQIQSGRSHIVPPYKKAKFTSVLPMSHIPPQFVNAMLSLASSSDRPILGLTKVQYRQAFKQVCAELDIAFTPHAARHLFCSYQALLGVPAEVRAAHLVHADPVKTTERVYTHELSAQEKAIVFGNTDIFKPAHPLYQFGAIQAPAH